MPVSRNGFGLTRMRSNRANSPSKEATSSRQMARMAATYSSVRAPRRAKGTPSASNSSRDHPMPTPKVSRPSDNRSRLAACFATITGLCSGSRRTPVATPMVEVAAAAKLRHTIGSSQSAVDGTAICPSAA